MTVRPQWNAKAGGERRRGVRGSASRLLWVLGAVFLIAGSAAVGALILIGKQAAERQRASDASVVHEMQVLLEAERLVLALQDVQRGERGFLLTSDRSFLEPYENGQVAAARRLRELRRLTQGNPAQQAQLAELETVVAQGLAEYRQIVDLALSGRRAEAFAAVAARQGKLLQDRARALLEGVISEEERRLTVRRAAELEARQQGEVALTALGGLGVLLVLVAGCFGAVALQAMGRARLATALEAARDDAEAANRAKSEFLANMSHELRTPLNGVIGVAEILRSTPLNDHQQDMVRIVAASAAMLDQLLSDILDLARVEAGRLTIVSEPFHLGRTVREAAALWSLKATENKVAFGLEIEPAAERMVAGDPLRLKQILVNLLSNAVKFTPTGAIELRVGAEAEGFRFTVRDTGIGFDAATHRRLFKRFEQADSTTTRRYGGSGLGLAISRTLAEMMGGELAAESTPGSGSTFTLTLPLLAPAEEAAPASALAA